MTPPRVRTKNPVSSSITSSFAISTTDEHRWTRMPRGAILRGFQFSAFTISVFDLAFGFRPPTSVIACP
jgi:hypothetical protein